MKNPLLNLFIIIQSETKYGYTTEKKTFQNQ